jgi:LysR family transcriptional regulator, glycine cleavage system transcriptional activator
LFGCCGFKDETMQRFHFPPLNSLRPFEAVARHMSIDKACKELHLTHSAVSRHVQRLERQIGCKLFRRSKGKLTLTDAGRTLSSAVTVSFTHLHRAFVELANRERVDRLVIAVDLDFAALWLVPRLGEFYAIVPDTLVEIRSEKPGESVSDPGVNCAIRYSAPAPMANRGELLFRSSLFPVCAKALIGVSPLRSSIDLRRQVLLHDRSTEEWEEYFQKSGLASVVNVRSGIVFSETALCLDAAARGQGVAIGDDYLAAMYLSEGRLIKPFGPGIPSRNAYYFLMPDDAPPHPAVAAFRSWLLRTIDRVRGDAPAL